MSKQGKIVVVGLGPGAAGHMSLETIAALNGADEVVLRTSIHPSVSELQARGIDFYSCDDCYAEADFSTVYECIVNICLEKARGRRIVYAVPGSPLVAEQTVVLLRERAKAAEIELEFLPAISFLDVVFTKLGIDPIQGLAVVDALAVDSLRQSTSLALLVTQVHNRQIASEVKLALMENYADEYKVVFLHKLGLPDEQVLEIPLFELDRQAQIDHLTSLYVPAKAGAVMDVEPLVNTLASLRAPGGCPWDREQDHLSLRRYFVEEVYELLEAIENSDAQGVCEELGDLLLQIVFHAQLGQEQGVFNMQDVVELVVEKMYRRHPHVFGNIKVQNAQEVLANWDEIKKGEYQDRKSVLDGIPKGLPALLRAYKLQGKAAKVGFDWPDTAGVWEKIDEELLELKEALVKNAPQEIEDEFGDVLFALVNLGRHLGCEAEIALTGTNNRFVKRFSFVESCVLASGKNWQDFSLLELENFWQQAKKM